jgi:hypothetical protein
MAAGSALRLHAHRFFVLDDGDGMEATSPPVGVYMVALQLRLEGYTASDPIYIAFGIPGTSLTALDSAARPWMSDHVDSLILEGDYDFDGDVDAGDFSTWRSEFGSTGPFPIGGDYADGNRDGVVDAADYVLWRNNMTANDVSIAADSALGIVGSVSAPEPRSLFLLLWTTAAGMFRVRRISKTCEARLVGND